MTESKQAADIEQKQMKTATDNAKQSGTDSDHDDVEFVDYDEIDDDEVARESMLRRDSGNLRAHILAQLAQQESGSASSHSQPDEKAIQEHMRRALQQQEQQFILSQMGEDNQYTQAEAEQIYMARRMAEQEGLMMPMEQQMDYEQQMDQQKRLMHFRQIEEEFIQHQMNLARGQEVLQVDLNGEPLPRMMPNGASAFGMNAAENATSFQPGPTFPSDQNTTWMSQDEAMLYNQQLLAAMHQQRTKEQMAAQMEGCEPMLTPEEILAFQQTGQMPQHMDQERTAMINQANEQAAMENLNMQGEGAKSQINFQGTWIEWFCSLEGNEFMLVVPRSFLLDKFNWIQLRTTLKLPKHRYEESQMLVLAKTPPTQADLGNESFLQLNQEASDMYGLMHARYLVSNEGLAIVYGKFLQGAYGQCPRALCNNQNMVPCGMSDKLRSSRVKVYCCKCEEMYIPSLPNQQRSNALDGAYFGSSIAHKFFATYEKAITLPPKVYFYEPQIYGFKIAGKVGSKYHEPRKDVIVDTEKEQDSISAKMGGKEGQTYKQNAKLKTASRQPPRTAAGNADKNNNNNKGSLQAVVISQNDMQQRKQKKFVQ